MYRMEREDVSYRQSNDQHSVDSTMSIINDLNDLTTDLNALIDSETRLRMASVTLENNMAQLDG